MTLTSGVDAPVGATAAAGRGRRSITAALLAVLGLGLTTMVAGTFLPWLRSGAARRNSYATDGLARQLLSPDGATHALLMVWPFLSALCALAAALLLVGLTRTGCVLAVGCAVAVGVVSARILSIGSNALIGVDRIGPIVTLTGCGVVAGVALALVRVLSTRHHQLTQPTLSIQRLHRSKRG